MDQDNSTYLYEKHRGMVQKAAWTRVAKNPGLEYDELVGVGNLAFCEAVNTWQPEKGAFSTHLHWQLRHRLGRANKKEVNRHLNTVPAVAEAADMTDPDRTLTFVHAMEALGSEAKEVVGLILGSAGELCDFTAASVKVTRGNIMKYFRSLGWPKSAVMAAITEIKEALKNL